MKIFDYKTFDEALKAAWEEEIRQQQEAKAAQAKLEGEVLVQAHEALKEKFPKSLKMIKASGLRYRVAENNTFDKEVLFQIIEAENDLCLMVVNAKWRPGRATRKSAPGEPRRFEFSYLAEHSRIWLIDDEEKFNMTMKRIYRQRKALSLDHPGSGEPGELQGIQPPYLHGRGGMVSSCRSLWRRVRAELITLVHLFFV